MTSDPALSVAFDALGVGVTIEANDAQLLDDVRRMLPAKAQVRPPAPGDDRFVLTVADDGRCSLAVNESVHERDNVIGGLIALDAHLHLHLISEAKELVFIHAGAVGVADLAILLTGGMGIGKSTLVAALLRAGAVYYTDDYAPIDQRGWLHPYPMPIGLRDQSSGLGREHSPESFGAAQAEHPIPVGLIAHVEYRPEGRLELSRLSPGDGSMLLLDNAFGVERRPSLAMTATTRAVANAVVLSGERGAADQAAAELIRRVRDLQAADSAEDR